MAVRIYKRMREWWRDPNEVVEGASDNPRARKLNEAYSDQLGGDEDESVLPDEDAAPELGDDAMGDDMGEAPVPPEVEDPAAIVDDVAGEDGADEIAEQITITIDGVTYNLVPAEVPGEGMEGMEGDTGEADQASLGLDTVPENDDITQPDVAAGEGEMPEAGDEVPEANDDEKKLEAAREKIRRRLEARRMKAKKNLKEEEAFVDGDAGADASADAGGDAGAVMEKLTAREKALMKEIMKVRNAKKKISEGEYIADPDLPMGKDVELASTSGPKNAYTGSSSGEDFTQKVGKDKSYAGRGPGQNIKSAQSINSGAKPSDYGASDGFNGRGPGQDPKKAYTPSQSGEAGPTGVKGSNVGPSKRSETARQRVLARRMRNLAEVEEFNPEGKPKGTSGGTKPSAVDPIGKAVPAGTKQVDTIEDVGDTTLEVAENTELFEKLKAIRAKRLARRAEGLDKAGVKVPDAKTQAKLEEGVKGEFSFRDFLDGRYE